MKLLGSIGIVIPAKEDVIQLAFPKNGCSKSKSFPNLVEKSPRYVWNLHTNGCAKASITAAVEQKFATVFSRANWITPSKAGVEKQVLLSSQLIPAFAAVRKIDDWMDRCFASFDTAASRPAQDEDFS